MNQEPLNYRGIDNEEINIAIRKLTECIVEANQLRSVEEVLDLLFVGPDGRINPELIEKCEASSYALLARHSKMLMLEASRIVSREIINLRERKPEARMTREEAIALLYFVRSVFQREKGSFDFADESLELAARMLVRAKNIKITPDGRIEVLT